LALNDLKKYLEELKNSQNPVAARPQEVLAFKDKAIGYLLASLVKDQHCFTDKMTVLEIQERDLISSKHNIALFNKLYTYLTEYDENVAIQASKAIDALIKQNKMTSRPPQPHGPRYQAALPQVV